MSSQIADRAATHFSNLGHVLTHMVTILYATAVLHLPSVFGLPYGEMLGFASLGLVLYGVAALPAGWLGDRWSQIGMMVVFFLGIGGASVLVGVAKGTNEVFIGLTLIGLFASIYHPVGIAWLIANAKKQGMTLGVNGLFGGMGSALAAPFVGMMIDFFSWRLAFILPGIISILAGIALLICWRRGQIHDVKSDRIATARPSANAMKRAFFVLTLTMACAGFVYAGLTNTMPKLFEEGLAQYVSSYTQLGLYVGAVLALSSLSGILGGWLADRFSPRAIYIGFWTLTIAPLFFIPTAVGAALLSLVIAALFLNTGFVAAENMLVARYTPFKWRSLAYGSKFVLALGVGGLTVKVAGDLFDATGSFTQLYVMLGAAAACATAAALLLPSEPATELHEEPAT
ncbi:MAG: MFS transporter [Gammaproteobacteria bacterium]|nr:MFS transporter [Gammaproteobacteria bacterium]